MRNTSKMVADAKLSGVDYGLFYNPTGQPVFSAERIQRTVAVFDSRPLVASANVTSWKSLSWTSSVPAGTRLFLYVRSASTEDGLLDSSWVGPMMNGASGEDISSETGKILQFRLAMYSSYDSFSGVLFTPTVNSVTASCYVQGSSQTFYTATMPLGFVPTHVILTYNGSIPVDTMVNFSVSTVNSTSPKDYKIINPNSIVNIEEIANGEFLKVSISALGNTEVPFIVDEFAIAVAGPGFKTIAT